MRARPEFPAGEFDERSMRVRGGGFTTADGMVGYRDFELSADALDDYERAAHIVLERIAEVRVGKHKWIRDYVRSNHGRLLDDPY